MYGSTSTVEILKGLSNLPGTGAKFLSERVFSQLTEEII